MLIAIGIDVAKPLQKRMTLSVKLLTQDMDVPTCDAQQHFFLQHLAGWTPITGTLQPSLRYGWSGAIVAGHRTLAPDHREGKQECW